VTERKEASASRNEMEVEREQKPIGVFYLCTNFLQVSSSDTTSKSSAKKSGVGNASTGSVNR
jgi:hypothetical protein